MAIKECIPVEKTNLYFDTNNRRLSHYKSKSLSEASSRNPSNSKKNKE